MNSPIRFPDDLPTWGVRRDDAFRESLVVRASDGFVLEVSYETTVVTVFRTGPR